MKKTIIILGSLNIVIIILLIVVINAYNSRPLYNKPVFDINAVDEIPKDLDYKPIVVSQEYKFYINGEPILDDNNELKVNFVSLTDDNILLKLRIYDNEKNLLGETGVIKAGNYIEKVKLIESKTEKYTYKVMGYDADTFESVGTLTMNTK